MTSFCDDWVQLRSVDLQPGGWLGTLMYRFIKDGRESFNLENLQQYLPGYDLSLSGSMQFS